MVRWDGAAHSRKTQKIATSNLAYAYSSRKIKRKIRVRESLSF